MDRSRRLLRCGCRIVPFVALVTLAACDDDDDKSPTGPVASATTDLAELKLPPANPEADGSSLIEISARIPEISTLQPRIVAFSTTAGTFAQGGTSVMTTPDATGLVKAYLRAPNVPSTAFLRLSAGQTVLTRSLEFTRALPETLVIEPEHFTVQADTVKGGEEITVTAHLRRGVGAVSPGQEVRFSAEAAGGATPRFGVATLSDAAGKVTVKYSPGPTKYRGPIVITARTRGINERELMATTTIDIIAWKSQ